MAAGNKFSISVVISAVDKFSAHVKRINDQVEKSLQPTKMLGDKIGSLWKAGGGAKVGSAFQNFSEAAGKTRDEFGKLLGKVTLFGGAAAAALGYAVHQTVEYGDGLKTLSDRTGLTTRSLQELQFAAERSDVPLESFNTGIMTMSKNMGMARVGSGKLAAFLKKANPAFLQQLKGVKSNEEAFALLVDGMQKLGDPQRQLALATAAFGSSGAEFLSFAKDGTKGIDQLRARARELGIVLDDSAVEAAASLDDILKDLTFSLNGVVRQIGSALLPVVSEWAKRFTEWISKNQDSIKQFARGIADFVTDVVPKIASFAEFLFGFFASYDEVTGKFSIRSGNIRLAMVALAAVVAGPLIASIGSLIVSIVALNATMAATPVGWIIGGIAAIIAIGALLWAYWDDIKQFFIDLWDDPLAMIWKFAQGIWQAFVWVGKLILNIFVGVMKTVFASIDLISRAVAGIVGTVARVAGMVPGLGKLGEWGKEQQRWALGAELKAPAEASTALTSNMTSKNESKVTVDFLNLPRGTKLKTESNDGVDLDLGMQFGPMTAMN